MPDQTYREGQTATSKDGMRRVVFRSGMWVNDTSYRPQSAEKAKTASQDRTELNAASAKAAAERDALRTYAEAERAIHNFGPFGTGPMTAKYLDMITPEEDAGKGSGWLGEIVDGATDTVGSVAGILLRPFVSQETWNARDHLKTVNANVALAGSQQMKGSSSDKDTALMRLSGIGPYKQKDENLRIIKQATYNSGLEQTRALLKSSWIGNYGSLSNPSPNGMTFEKGLQMAEKRYDEYFKGQRPPRSKTASKGPQKALPTPPPRKRAAQPLTIDLDGNVVR